MDGDLLLYSINKFDAPRTVIANDLDLRARIIHEYHDAPIGGHLGREKTFAAVSRDFFWPHMYKWVRNWVRTCEICQRVKPSPSSQAPLRPLPIAAEAWRSVSMDFIFGLAPDGQDRTGILVFVDRFSKMTHLVPVHATITAAETAVQFIDTVFRHHGLPDNIVSDRDPRFTSAFWTSLFEFLGTKLQMSTAAHPETDGQTERINWVLEDVLRSYATSFTSWSEFSPLAEFALNNAVHASTGLTPFFANLARHPRVLTLLAVGQPTALRGYTLVGGDSGKQRSSASRGILSAIVVTQSKVKPFVLTPRDVASPLAPWTAQTLIDPSSGMRRPQANYAPIESARPFDDMAVSEFILQRQAITRFVRDTLRSAVDKNRKRMQTNVAERTQARANSRTFHRTTYGTQGDRRRIHAVHPLRHCDFTRRFTLGGPRSIVQIRFTGWLRPQSQRLIGRLSLSTCSTCQRHRTRLRPSLRVPKNLAFQVPHPFKQLAVRLSNLARCFLSPRSLIKGSFSFQLGIDSLVQNRSYIFLSNQDASGTIARAHHRLWTRKVSSAGSWNAYWVTRPSSRLHERTVSTARKYRVRWLGFPPDRDTWEPCSSLLRDIPEVVRAYESVHTLGPDSVDELSVLTVSENETNDDCVVVKRHHDYETKSDCENVVVKRYCDDEIEKDDENVVLNVYRQDHANENDVASAWHHDPENASGVASVTRHDEPRFCAPASCAHTVRSRAVYIR
uniref:Integrase catalytic domain-containing protein n=1 Tax=Peronospora matthiolae TaxID=2874970 RepID=A0AAV1UUW9_9STRA